MSHKSDNDSEIIEKDVSDHSDGESLKNESTKEKSSKKETSTHSCLVFIFLITRFFDYLFLNIFFFFHFQIILFELRIIFFCDESNYLIIKEYYFTLK